MLLETPLTSSTSAVAGGTHAMGAEGPASAAAAAAVQAPGSSGAEGAATRDGAPAVGLASLRVREQQQQVLVLQVRRQNVWWCCRFFR